MSRRRGREKSARAMRREAKPYTPPAPVAAGAPPTRTIQAHFYRAPPPWLTKGVIVHYSPVIGAPPIKKNCRVIAEPFLVAGHPDGRWVTLIDKHRGWVACEALSPAT